MLSSDRLILRKLMDNLVALVRIEIGTGDKGMLWGWGVHLLTAHHSKRHHPLEKQNKALLYFN